MVDDDEDTSKDKEIDKLMALISLSLDNSPRIHRNAGYEGQKSGTVAGARDTIGSSMVQKSRIQCYNYKEYGLVARECQKPKRAKDAAYHREKMLLCKQEEAGIQLNAEQADWKDDTDDESDDQELEAHYMYMAKLQQVSLDAIDSGPIFDTEPEQKVQNDDHYDVFAIECQHSEQSESVHNTYLIEQDVQNVSIESVDMNYDKQADWRDDTDDEPEDQELEAHYIEHPEQSKSVNDTYPIKQDKHNVIDSLDISYDREQINQDDDDDALANEHDLIASLIDKLKCEIDDSKNRSKFLETSNKVLVDKLKGEIEDFKTKNKSLESSNNHFKEANNELSKTNELMYKDLKKFQAELDRHNDVKLSQSQLKTQKTQFLNEIDRLSREYYYADHMNTILGVYTELDEVTNLQCDYLESLEKCECLEKEFSKSKKMSKSFEALQKHAINLELDLQQIILFIVDSGCSKHMTGNLMLLTNFVEKFLGSVKFGNDQIAPILGYGDLVQRAVTIKRVYYVEGLNHNLFSVGQFYDADLEVAFRKPTCYIRGLKGNDLLTGSHGTDLYSITLQDTSSP
nr:integrase, catalytic region, zinc finger, CCHC-type, peptidase aspartic, catalytic [Tanacetum cinerariifolium]